MKHIILGMMKEHKKSELFAFCLLVVLPMSSVWLLVIKLQDTSNISNQTQGYTRYVACMIDVRNEKGVVALDNHTSDACWKAAEKETGIPLVRYSEKILLNK